MTAPPGPRRIPMVHAGTRGSVTHVGASPVENTNRPHLIGGVARVRAVLLLAVCLAWPTSALLARIPAPAPSHNASAVVGVQAQHLNPQYWIDRLPQPDRVLLDTAAIAAQNQRLHQQDQSIHDLESLPARLSATQVRDWVSRLSTLPTRALYHARGQRLGPAELQSLLANTALNALPAHTPVRYALVVKRADLRTFPSHLQAFRTPGDTDIDRFQESALFPGTAVAVIHTSQDRQWSFVISATYAAWMESRYLAEGPREQVLEYAGRRPALIVTGATVHTVYTPEQPAVSALQLDMGVRVPRLDDWPAGTPVNGQHPYTAWVIQLPMRDRQGRLALVPALLPKTADVSPDYLPLTPAHLIQQGFKFLGERYGWGHAYNARDCSGFVSEVYRSFGVQMPRNTGDQAVSPAFNRITLSAQDDRQARMQLLRDVQVGDLIYIPGHVMMVIGQENGLTYLIHDTPGIRYTDAQGQRIHVPLNAVSVTPLEPLLLDAEHSFVDSIYSIQRIRP